MTAGGFEIRVAAVAAHLPTYLPPLGDQGFDLLYRERLTVTLQVSQSESLADVQRRAIAAFDPQIDMAADPALRAPVDRPYFAWFHEPQDEVQGLPGREGRWQAVRDLITIDSDGLARFNREAEEILYGDLLRAAEADLLEAGDPYRPYVVLLHPQGGLDSQTRSKF